MSFKLLIECSKDITQLQINFADGTSTVTSGIKAEKTHRAPKSDDDVIDKPRGRKEQFLNTDADYSSVSQEVVALPKIDIKDRPISVAPELQNLDF